jgi:hypothetical protein
MVPPPFSFAECSHRPGGAPAGGHSQEDNFMARATQGLQVVLIISVMLNVVLGVTTYLYNKQAFEKTGQAKAEMDKAQQAAKEKQDVEQKFERARAIIGNREWDMDAIDKKFDEDSQLAGQAPAKPAAEGEKPAITMGYSQMVVGLCKALDDRTMDLKKLKNEFATLQTDFHNREAAKDEAIAKNDAGFNSERERINKINEDYRAREAATAANETAVNSRTNQVLQMANGKTAAAENRTLAAQKMLADKEKEMKPLLEERSKYLRKEMDVPSGEITWVSLPTKTVWINRGREDSLQRGIRFTVYSAESNAAATAVEKGSVEVTRIVAPHQAECRIVDDKFADPIASGDKIFTAFWSPGQQNHFALSGIMNLDGDGRNQVNTAIGLVKSYGGVVDCWLDEQGHKQGQITAATQYVIHGDLPDKSSAETVKNNGEIIKEAVRYQLHDWSLADFKQKMNYQKSSSVERFGAGATGGGSERPAVMPKPKAAKAPAAESKTEDAFNAK